jgi:uncharacterized membrane protein
VRWDEGAVRVVAPGPTFRSMTDQAFDQIRHYGRGDVRVLSRMLDILGELGATVTDPARRAVVEDHLVRTMAVAAEHVPAAHDRLLINSRFAAVCERIAAPDLYAAWALPERRP